MHSEKIRQYYLSRENLLRIVEYRGYSVSSDLHYKTIDEFITAFDILSKMQDVDGNEDIETLKKEMSGSVFYNSTPSINTKNSDTTSAFSNIGIMIGWYPDHKLGVSIRDTVDDMEKKGVNKAIIVADEGVTAGCKDILKNLKIVKKISIDVMTLRESMIFVPDHTYVPSHRICTFAEKKALFKSYGLKTKDKLPYIKSDEIVIKYLGASKNQLIEINRISDTDPEKFIKTYRIVV